MAGPGAGGDMSRSAVAGHREAWARKPALRAVYLDIYRRIADRCVRGPVVEIGAGPGLLKTALPESISVDIQPFAWIDVVADAHALPLRDGAVATLILFDALHHLARPARFFAEAERALRPGGRIVIVEPAVTPVSSVMYRLFHHERVEMAVDPLGDAALSSSDPDDSNQAIATLLFGRDYPRFSRMFPNLKLAEKSFLSLLAYPLTGGFQPWSLLPAALAQPLLRVESALLPLLGPAAGFRLFVVLEKTA
jgi:SAM-dependent methyltransferase